MKKVALFDFDGTLTTKDTNRILIIELIKYNPKRLIHVFLDLFYIFFANKKNNIQDRKNVVIGKLIKGLSRSDLDKPLDKFKERVSVLFRDSALKAITKHKKQNNNILVVTASPEFAISKVLENFNVNIIGTSFDCIKNEYSGMLSSPNCIGKEKVNRIIKWQHENKDDVIYLECWGDSIEDMPMMLLAKEHFWIKSSNLNELKKVDPEANFTN
tara:strand:- start:5785 stop:6426 length:642 start_codon:yes stop_codon:yes gene_type:complete